MTKKTPPTLKYSIEVHTVVFSDGLERIRQPIGSMYGIYYISLHLVDFYGKCREKNPVHGCYGIQTLLETNSKFAPENGWLEDDCFLLGPSFLVGEFNIFREAIL